MRILITSVGTATSVNLIKHFNKSLVNDCYIVGTDTNEKGYTAGSILVDKFYQVSNAKKESFFNEIINIVNNENIDLLIPVNDIEVECISKNRNILPCKCVTPDINNILIMKDKYLCSNEMDSLSIAIPEILNYKDRYNFKTILRERIGVGSKGIKIMDSDEVIPKFNEDYYFLQRYIEGEEYTIDVLSDLRCNPIYAIPRKRLEVKSGISTKMELINDKELINCAIKIIKHFQVPGFSNIQFIKDEQGQYWFLEINYRFSGGGSASLISSKDYLKCFIDIVNDKQLFCEINHDTRWNSIVTRFYEEILYEKSVR